VVPAEPADVSAELSTVKAQPQKTIAFAGQELLHGLSSIKIVRDPTTSSTGRAAEFCFLLTGHVDTDNAKVM
jgi:hypothetical protein